MGKNNQVFNVSRRNLIRYGGGFLGTGLAATILGSNLSKPEASLAQNSPVKNMTPDEALQILIEGNKRFIENKRQYPRQDIARLTEVAEKSSTFCRHS